MAIGTYAHLDLSVKDEVLTVRLNRPEHLNAINGALHSDLARLFSTLRHEHQLGAIVITGAGRAFCAGGDAHWFGQATPQDTEQMVSEARSLVFDLLELGPPVICALNGPAAGFGATLALLCDVVIAEESATIADPHVRMGVVAGDGGAAIWPALVGVNRAKEYLMTGDRLTAREGERIGVINHVVADGTELDEAHALAHRLANGARQAIFGTKRAINQVLRLAIDAAFETSLVLESQSLSTADHHEAVTAFAEGRKPVFEASRRIERTRES